MSRPTTKLVRVNDQGYPVGQDHHRARFTDHEIDLVLELLADGMSHRELAHKFDCSRGTISGIASGRRRSQLVTRTVRRPIRYEEPEFEPAAWHEFDAPHA